MSVSDLYIPRISLHISLQQNRQTDSENIYSQIHIYEFRNKETELYYSVLEISVSFLEIHKWEPDMDSHRPFICSADTATIPPFHLSYSFFVLHRRYMATYTAAIRGEGCSQIITPQIKRSILPFIVPWWLALYKPNSESILMAG